MWGSNARETHPIFFHHVLAARERGARIFVVDPRRTATADWAERWLGLRVGTDIALALAVGREIIHAGLVNMTFVERATSGFAEYMASAEEWTLERAEAVTGVASADIVALAHAYAMADRAQLCWTLGITEHHNGVDNVVSLINLALLTGHVGRAGSGLSPLRGQNNVQGGGDMGAVPNRLPGFQDILDDEARTAFDRAWGTTIQPRYGKHLTAMFEAMEHGELRTVFCLGENPAQSEADITPRPALAAGPRPPGRAGHLPHQDCGAGPRRAARHCSMVRIGGDSHELGAAGPARSQGSRRPRGRPRRHGHPAGARGPARPRMDLWRSRRLGGDSRRGGLGRATHGLAHAPGYVVPRIEALSGIQWPCYDMERLEPPYLHGRLWADDPAERGKPAPFSVVHHDPPVDPITDEYPLLLTTGRRLDSYNTGVQSGAIASPLRQGETIDLSAHDAADL